MDTQSPRVLSLDVFRGLTIAGMILVNSPGNDTAYTQLDHAAWNGLTCTDLVFPFFVFIVGAALVFSISRRREQGASDADLLAQIVRRMALIFGFGLLLNGFPYYHLSTIRILGVLQRIALTYFFAAVLFMKTRLRTQVGIAAALLVGYWLVMTRLSIFGHVAGDLSKEGNLAALIDRMFLSGHMYRPVYDPEGLLSTLPAIATAILGVLTGVWMRSPRSDKEKVRGMGRAGTAALLAGWAWGFWFPVNKALWTSSYVLVTAGLALILLALCHALIEIYEWRSWTKPFEIFGRNAIAAYVLHILFLKIQNLVHIGDMNLRFWTTAHAFGWLSPVNASLAYALTYTLLWYAVLRALDRRKIYIKI